MVKKKSTFSKKENKFSWKMLKTKPLAFLATLGPVGYFPKGPGTLGSLAALPLAYLASTTSVYMLWAFVIFFFMLGLSATAQFTAKSQEKDPGCVIIDEVAGQLVAFLTVIPPLMHWDMLLLGFILFRCFDIFKFGPVAYWDRKKTPLGVMMDDIMAGILAGFVLAVIQAFLIQ